jgi:AcrR family transcriptional regulator
MSGGATRGRRERKDRQRNLERVLRAARELFAERGSAVTMEEVAQRAGVGVGTIYRRFPSKEHLFTAVSHAACGDVLQYLEQAVHAERDPISKLRVLVLMQYRYCTRHAALLEMHLTPDQQQGGAKVAQQHLYTGLHHLLQQLIMEGQQHGVMGRGDPAVLSALCLELLNPHACKHLQRVVGGHADEVAEHVIWFLLNGLGAHKVHAE